MRYKDYKKNPYIKRVNIYRKELPYWLSTTLKSIFIAFLILCIIAVIFNFIYINTPVSGYSMRPTLNNYSDPSIQDSVYINRFGGFDCGDIIVVNNPTGNNKSDYYVIKRLIAKGGDKIAIVRLDVTNDLYGIVRIRSGSKTLEYVDETSYLKENANKIHTSYVEYQKLIERKDLVGCKVVEVNNVPGAEGIKFLEIDKDYVFYMGDNRIADASNDCLDYGPVLASKVLGKANIIVYKSQNYFGQVFLYFIHEIFG